MRTCAKPRASRLSRILRELRPDANPLRPACDRIQAWIMVALFGLFLAGAPAAAVMAGQHVFGAGIHAQRTSHPVTAILLARAQSSRDGGQSGTAPATWTAPGDNVRFGRVRAPAADRAGTTVTIWVGPSGQLTGAPLRGADLARDVAVAAVFTVLALGALLTAAARLARWVLQRRRLAAWEADWRSTEPRWVRRS